MPGESLLWQRVSSGDARERMPADADPLEEGERELLRKWILAGAVWDETEADRLAARDGRLDHWAWQPLSPEGAQDAGGIDGFIDAALAKAGLHPLPEADDRTLVRRLFFDLTGLPPRWEDVEAFSREAARDREAAVASLVDRLLESPRYGERWARHWLDISHYADTHGFERDMRRPHAWPYRDWVIRVLNRDTPYDEFLRLQIAGDVLRPDDPEAVVATGFLAAGPWDFVGQVETPSPVIRRLARAGDLDDMVTQVMAATTAVTVNCARCHDHKLDPVTQEEYYALTAVFAGVKRGERVMDGAMAERVAEEEKVLKERIKVLQDSIVRERKTGLDLADLVAGGDGKGSGRKGSGIHPGTGKVQQALQGYLSADSNRVVPAPSEWIEGVWIPDGGSTGKVPFTTGGRVLAEVPDTSGKAWDAIRSGPANAQKNTRIGGTDFNSSGHSLLAMHANSAITFLLAPMRKALGKESLRFRAEVGFGGDPGASTKGVDVRIHVGGVLVFLLEGLGAKHGRVMVDVPLESGAEFLTMMVTDGGDGEISHDQAFFGDPLVFVAPDRSKGGEEIQAAEEARRELDLAEKALRELKQPDKVYGVIGETPPSVHVLRRGNPEDPAGEVAPGTLSLLRDLPFPPVSASAPEGERRKALAAWITDPRNPLTPRVMVNRIWHHHFGTGLVDTPSDFGLGGGRPSHPGLLDFLARDFIRKGWSLKAMHRLICNSAAYRRTSFPVDPAAVAVDAGNRLLWRGPVRKLDAESLRDAVLKVAGTLDETMYGPGWEDFAYEEAYAPVYRYRTPDDPALWRRAVYRFVVRTTPHPFLSALDGANPSLLSPVRNKTTTALQSLALLNNDFVMIQAAHFARSLPQDDGSEKGIREAFARALCRQPSDEELGPARNLVEAHGWEVFCRMLFNGNEFVLID
jgi:hypothetical protein